MAEYPQPPDSAELEPLPDPLLSPAEAAIHAAQFRSLAALEIGIATVYDQNRADVGNHRTVLWRSLELAALGCRRRARHYAGLARSLQVYAQAPLAEPDPVLAALAEDGRADGSGDG